MGVGAGEVGPGISGTGGGGGGTTPGVSIVRKFPFAFNSPGILTGHILYTPTIGDILLDAWFEVDTAWDGTTPFADIGTFQTGNRGWFQPTVVPVDLTDGGGDIFTSDGLTIQFGPNSLANQTAMNATHSLLEAQLDHIPPTQQNTPIVTKTPIPQGSQNLTVPAKFTAAHPIKVVVSQDGSNTGADPGSTMGAAVLYLVTATPV